MYACGRCRSGYDLYPGPDNKTGLCFGNNMIYIFIYTYIFIYM